MLHIQHTLNLSGFHHGTLGQIPVPLKRLKGLLYFFKALKTSGHMLAAKLRGRFEMKFWGADF